MCLMITMRWQRWRAAMATMSLHPRWRRDGFAESVARVERSAIRGGSGRRKRGSRVTLRSTRLRAPSRQQSHRIGGLLPELIEAALPRRLVGPPAQDGGAVAKSFAAEMIVANLDHEFWLQRTPLCRTLGRPSARPARRIAGEAGRRDQRFEF